MRVLYIFTIIVAVPLASFSQSTPAFTLEQCVAYALENSYDIKNAHLDEKIALARVRETTGIGLPQVSASATLQHYNDLPRMFMTKQTLYDFSKPTDPDTKAPMPFNEFFPGLAGDDVFATENIFQLKNSGNAGFSLNQLLFNGSYLVGLQAAKAYKNLSVKATNQAKETTISQVMKAFYGVLINKDRIQLYDNNIKRVDSLLVTTKALNENGFAEAIDVDRIQVTLNNLKAERSKFVNLQELSLELLKFQMNYPIEKDLNVAGDIALLAVDQDVLNEYEANWTYEDRADYQVLLANKRLEELNVKNKYAESLPSLAAFGNYGWSTQSADFGGLFKTTNSLEGVEDKWYPVSYVGVSLNVPIFSGLQQTYKIQQAKLSLLKTENAISKARLGVDLEIRQTAITYLNAVTSLKSQEENRILAERVARVTKIKYEEGVGSNIEVIDAESSLKEAQINYYNSLYDALVAKVDLDKAYGKLNQQNIETNK